MRRLTLEYVKTAFKAAGCRLLADGYRDSKTRMPYVCECGNHSHISYGKFKTGQRCQQCRVKKIASKLRHSFEFVKRFFADQGCVLLASEYIDANTLMPYVCNCGRRSEIRFGSFQSGQRCKRCAANKAADTKRLPFEFVRNYFRQEECVLLATSYENNLTLMPYICNCGRKSQITFGSFQQGHRCKQCANEKLSASKRLNFEFVKRFFADHGCVLLAHDYERNDVLMPYTCVCGRQSEITFAKFQDGQRCKDCGRKKLAALYKHSFEFVKRFFADQGCVLLASEYSNSDTVMPYTCKCGRYAEINFSNFSCGQRCKSCASENNAFKKRHSFEFVKLFFAVHGCTLLTTQYLRNDDKLPYICVCGEKSTIRFSDFMRGNRCNKCRYVKIWQTRRHNEMMWEDAELDIDIDKLLQERKDRIGT